jgi:hypothetical protein
MQDRFGRLSWARVLRKFRRRRPTMPIRRKPPGLELVRLDDRIAPGSVWTTAAVQALTLSVPLPFLGPAEPELAAVGFSEAAAPGRDIRVTSSDGDTAGDDSASTKSPYFSRPAPDDESGKRSANAQVDADSPDRMPWSSALEDFTEPGEASTAADQAESGPTDLSRPTGAGEAAPIGTPEMAAPRSGGIAVSGGLPGKPSPDAGSASPPASQSGAGNAKGNAAANAGRPQVSSRTPWSSHGLVVPAGHFAAQLQSILHPGDLAGGLGQQSQSGAWIGSQLTTGVGLSATAAAHRPASLLGQAVGSVSGQSVGLRTSPTSSGPFGLVGTQSIGDMVSGHGPPGGGLLGGPDKIAAGIPVGGSPSLPAPMGHSLSSPAAGPKGDGPNFVVLATSSFGTSGGSTRGKSGPSRQDPGQAPDATFHLTIPFWSDTFEETGTIDFPSNFANDGGTYWLNVHVHATETNGYDSESSWGWYAYPVAGPNGFDLAGLALFESNLDAFNAQYYYEYVNNSDPGYSLTVAGDAPVSVADTSNSTAQAGTVTTAKQNNFLTTGTDTFSITVHGPAGTARTMSRDDSVNVTFDGTVTGTDTDSANPAAAPVTNDRFGSGITNSTSIETEHVEGSLSADGTFSLASFSIDETDDYDYSDSLNGTESTPEPGGSESDTFSDSDSGHDHEHLHAAGTVDSWTASFDDNAGGVFNDQDHGSESSAQSGSNGTDTNSDAFHETDGGIHTDVSHLGGSGDSSTFTATSISDRVEDAYGFDEGDGGHSGETATGETDGDDYGNADHGDADEVLNLSGGAASLTAGYRDTVHDWYTDSDRINEDWSGPDGSAGNDSGHDTSTDGDNGGDTVTLSADATMANWQDDSAADPPPTWQVGAIGADITGSSAVSFGDGGSDTDTSAANIHDSDSDVFSDTSTGTETFQAHLTGHGDTATLTPSVTYNLTTNSHDDNVARWNDPETVNNESGSDSGSDTTHAVEQDSGRVTVGETIAIAADGTSTVSGVTVNLHDDGNVQESEIGSDDLEIIDQAQADIPVPGATGSPVDLPGVHDRENITDSANLGETIDIVTADAGGGVTGIDIDQQVHGPISLGGGENDNENENPKDTDTDIGSGTLSGPVTGDIHQTGTVNGDSQHLNPANGSLDPNLTGTANDTNVEVIDAPAGSGLSYPVPNLIDVAQFQDSTSQPEVGTGTAGLFDSAHVTVTTTISVPNAHVDDSVVDTLGIWSVANFSSSGQGTTTRTIAGHYVSTPDHQVDPWGGGTIDRTMTLTDSDGETINGSGASGASGNEVTGHRMSLTDDESWTSGSNRGSSPATQTGNSHYQANFSRTDAVSGGSSGPVAEVLTETGSGSGNDHRVDSTADGTNSATGNSTLTESHSLSQTGTGAAGQMTLTAAAGTDNYLLTEHWVGQTATTGGDGWRTTSRVRTRSLGADGEVADEELDTGHSWGTATDLATGQQTSYDDYVLPTDHSQEEPGLFAQALAFVSDVNAKIGTAAVSAAKWVGSAAYAVAHKAVQPIYMGYDLLQCGYVAVYGGITGDYFEPDWASDLAKNSPKDPNDKEAWGRYLVEAELDNLKDGAIAVATLGAGKVLGPVAQKAWCKVTGGGCFAAGTPARLDHGCIAVEQVREGTEVLTVEEDNLDGAFTTQPVGRTFQRFAVIWEVHVAGRVVRTTHEHPFYVRHRGWTPVAEIQAGDQLRTGERGWARCERVVDTGRAEVVYNFEVQGDHTYFVGDSVTWGFSLWAHNYNVAQNAVAGARREAQAARLLARQNPGASIQAQRTLRGANGKRLIDPLTQEGRRVDFAVVKDGQVVKLVEVTSQNASKVAQLAKEESIRQLGDVFIRDKLTRALLDVSDIVTEVLRLP